VRGRPEEAFDGGKMSDPEDIETLADAYPKAQAYVRELIQTYRSLSHLGNCTFAIACCEDVLRRADKASAEHDTVEMVRMLQEMRECQ
jgi:hypothetical protein